MAKKLDRNFPGGPVVKKAACNAGGVGSILGQRAKVPHVTEELNLGAATAESWRSGACVPHLGSVYCKENPASVESWDLVQPDEYVNKY